MRIGRYDVVRELGRGGMGAVYLATDPELQRSVALKLLHRGDGRARFRGEARALAALNHPGIVTIYEIGDHAGQQFIAMEYLDGRSLRELLEDAAHGPSRERLVAICRDVAHAVRAAHDAGILHRDIKPENVVVAASGAVKVVDFGIARRLDESSLTSLDEEARAASVVDAFEATLQLHAARSDNAATVETAVQQITSESHTVFGTPAYMAPEVLHGDGSTAASDVYSLGVMLYECLAGRRPYEARTLVALMAVIVDPSEQPAPLDHRLAPLIARMLARDPDDRPAIGDVIDALAEPAPLRPALPRRSRVPLILAGTTCVLALLGTGVWLARDEPRPAVQHAQVSVAVQDITIRLSSYGDGQPSSFSIGDLIARLLGRYERITPISAVHLRETRDGQEPWEAAARRLDARWLVRGRVESTGPKIVGTLELVELATGRIETVSADAPGNDLAAVLDGLAARAAGAMQPGTREASSDRALALSLLQVGTEKLYASGWLDARMYLEQAVHIDPQLPGAWAQVAAARGWSIATASDTERAIDRAIDQARDPTARELWRGAKLFYLHDYRAAITMLTPIADRAELAADQRDLARYYLGEAYFHDGQLAEGMRYFTPLVERVSPYQPAAIHASEYALARYDYERAARYMPLHSASVRLDLARGRYDKLLDTNQRPYDVYGYVLLGQPVPASVEARLAGPTAKIYRLAASRDEATARKVFQDLWRELSAAPVNSVTMHLQELFEVVACAGWVAETKQMLEHLRPHANAFRAFRRYEMLAAPLVGGPARFSRNGLTTRELEVADAIEAELAGDRATAARVLGELVNDPSTLWDYVERAALARNLAALGKKRELAELCKRTMRPAVFRWAWLPLARICKAR